MASEYPLKEAKGRYPLLFISWEQASWLNALSTIGHFPKKKGYIWLPPSMLPVVWRYHGVVGSSRNSTVETGQTDVARLCSDISNVAPWVQEMDSNVKSEFELMFRRNNMGVIFPTGR